MTSLTDDRLTPAHCDLTFNRFGYGAMQLAGPHVFGPPKDRAAAIAVLRAAVALGIDHIDSADFYGPTSPTRSSAQRCTRISHCAPVSSHRYQELTGVFGIILGRRAKTLPSISPGNPIPNRQIPKRANDTNGTSALVRRLSFAIGTIHLTTTLS